MPKPRTFNADLDALREEAKQAKAALQARAKAIRARKVEHLGELVVATGADTMDDEVLVGALLKVVERSRTDANAKEAWRRGGQDWFRAAAERGRRSRNGKGSPGTGEAASGVDGDQGGGASEQGGSGQG